MDYRRVEKKIRKAALFLQVALFLLLIAYVGLCIKQIFDASAHPPVETVVEPWTKGLGYWALCAGSEVLAGVGTAVGSSALSIHTPMGENALSPAKVDPPEMTIKVNNIVEQNCSYMDLREVEVKIPFFFILCNDGGFRSYYYVKSGDSWMYVTHQASGQLKWAKIRKTILGWNYGYATDEETYIDSVMMEGAWGGGDRSGKCANMTWFHEPLQSASALFVSVEEHMVMMYYKQGVLPQLVKLLTSTGGYLTILMCCFTCVFVKLHPGSSVSQIYEARTFVGKKVLPWILGQDTKTQTVKDTEPRPLPVPPGLWNGLDTE